MRGDDSSLRARKVPSMSGMTIAADGPSCWVLGPHALSEGAYRVHGHTLRYVLRTALQQDHHQPADANTHVHMYKDTPPSLAHAFRPALVSRRLQHACVSAKQRTCAPRSRAAERRRSGGDGGDGGRGSSQAGGRVCTNPPSPPPPMGMVVGRPVCVASLRRES
jgi:hypothetical protein